MAMSYPQIALAAEAEAGHARADDRSAPIYHAVPETGETAKDHFKTAGGVRFAGIHLLLDMWQARHLDDPDALRRALEEAVTAAGATLLHIHLHRFTPYGGVSGVAVLAESHISLHTWPERGFAAFDIFMCGRAEPEKAAQALQRALRPDRVERREHRRGIL